ncbi:hypothetical protein [Chryseobacterium scophthalmum]|uniref:Uncharacterized protein n=1 Tax=Chryseobacterium scophthalmum TaxID=59733 RepID=A0A1N6HVG7_9FLAO|nr:hypothetical protein [Chryseobacterium scophthalmum]SIO23812.1 hypothetical protein SAMN05421769_2906 [Chryseobacterium scophthalmum]
MEKTNEILKERFEILKTTELLNDDKVKKRKWETKFYDCDAGNNDVKIYISVVSPNLMISNAAFFNNDKGQEIDVSSNPINIGKCNALKGQRLVVYSVASSNSDNVKYTLNVDLKCNGKKKSFSTSLSLKNGETGEIIQDINFS